MPQRLFALIACLAIAVSPAAPRAAEGESWFEVTSDHFIVYTDVDEAEAMALAKDLERFRATLALLTGLDMEKSLSPPLRVFAYSDRRDYTGRYGMAGTGGFYMTPADGPVAVLTLEDGDEVWEAKGIETLFHEYTHHIVHQFAPIRYPRWYDEGFAEFVSTMEFREGKVIVGKPPMNRFLALREAGDWLDIEDIMEAKGAYITRIGPRVSRNLDRHKTGIYHHYAQGWLITHFIHTHEKYRKRLGKYLSNLQNPEVDPEDVFENIFEISYWDFDKEVRDYWYSYQLPAFTIDLSDKIDEISVRTRHMSPEEAVAIDYEGRLLTGRLDGDDDEAEEAFTSVLEAGQQEMKMQQLLAQLALGDKQWDSAERHIDKMLAANPGHAPALALKASLMHQRLEEDDPQPEDLQPIRAACVKAIKAEPTYVPALVTFARLHLEDALAVNSTVLKIVESIRFLAPDYGPGRELEVLLLAKAGRYEDALVKARRLVDWAPSRSTRREYEDLLERVEEMQQSASERG